MFFLFLLPFSVFLKIIKCPLSYILGKKVLEELAHKFWSRKPVFRCVFIVTCSQWFMYHAVSSEDQSRDGAGVRGKGVPKRELSYIRPVVL